MTLPNIEAANIDELADIASADGDLRNQSQEQAIDLAILFDVIKKNLKFKTGEKVFDPEQDDAEDEIDE